MLVWGMTLKNYPVDQEILSMIYILNSINQKKKTCSKGIVKQKVKRWPVSRKDSLLETCLTKDDI